jgi:Tfp pilus assembly protein PilF
MLGFVYSYTASNPYSAKQAIAELTLAAQLDPTYAFPHTMLADVYTQQHKNAQAKKEHLIYESLLPKSAS